MNNVPEVFSQGMAPWAVVSLLFRGLACEV